MSLDLLLENIDKTLVMGAAPAPPRAQQTVIIRSLAD